ncbi:hypothetical protein N579_10260 [Corynebacterium pseudodiphtheriticum 090104]|nr:hypothetical protein N579_10260 [Corynebacterium pseudodiphtheriticum 090104]
MQQLVMRMLSGQQLIDKQLGRQKVMPRVGAAQNE